MNDSKMLCGLNNTYCCVPQCTSGAWKDKSLSFHKFPGVGKSYPRDVHERALRRRKRWIVALRMGKPVSESMVVCSKHFQKSDFFTHRQGFPGARKVLKRNAIPSLNLPVPSTPSNDNTIFKATLRKIESDERYDSKARLSMKSKDVKKQLETISKDKSITVSSNSSGSSILIKSSDELNKVTDTSSTSEGIEVNPDTYKPTVLKTNSIKPHSNLTEQNHSDLTERDTLSDFNEDTDSDITTSDDEVMNNSENESEFSEESSKCQLEKMKARYKELQMQLKKYEKQCKLLTNDNDNLRKENTAQMKENYALMKENDCLKEVINSLRQIISVSDEKYFEAVS